jgi:hypothetical protein
MSRPSLPHVPLWCGAAYRLIDVNGTTVLPVRLLRASSLAYPRIHTFEHLDISFPVKEIQVVEITRGSYTYLNKEIHLELA